MTALYNAELIVTFTAEDIDEADSLIDSLISWLEDFHDFNLESALIDESVTIEEE